MEDYPIIHLRQKLKKRIKTFIVVSHVYLLTNSVTICMIAGVRVMVFNVIFNNISAISWWSTLLVEETGVPGENHRPVASH
jgi:hypothetical protein